MTQCLCNWEGLPGELRGGGSPFCGFTACRSTDLEPALPFCWLALGSCWGRALCPGSFTCSFITAAGLRSLPSGQSLLPLSVWMLGWSQVGPGEPLSWRCPWVRPQHSLDTPLLCGTECEVPLVASGPQLCCSPVCSWWRAPGLAWGPGEGSRTGGGRGQTCDGEIG